MHQQKRVHSAHLETAFFGFLAVCIALTAVAVAMAVHSKATVFEENVKNELVLRSARALSIQFNTSLEREWDSIRAVAANVAGSPKSELDDFMDAVPVAGGRVQWAGFANLDGTIVSGSNRIWEGRSFAEQRVFKEGMFGEAVGNVYESTGPFGSESAEPVRIVNFSLPVRDEAGETVGVLIYSVRIAWVESLLGRLADGLQLEIAVIDRRGDYVVDTLYGKEGPLPEAVRTILNVRNPGALHLSDAADGDRLFAVMPGFTLQSMPSFGWDLVVSLREDKISNALPDLRNAVFSIVAIAACCVILVVFTLFKYLVWPFKKLSANAYALANGRTIYPGKISSSREAETLSEALALLQTRLELPLDARKALKGKAH